MATVRNMRREELDVVLFSWARKLGWEPGTYDAGAFWAADPLGFFVAEVEEGGEKRVVGSVSGIAYGEHYGFIGLYIVDEAFRGRGIGLQLFRHAMQRLDGRNVGLDAVVEQEANYARSGFASYGRSRRFHLLLERNAPTTPPPASAGAHVVVPVAPEDWERVLPCDRWVFPARRPEFLRQWIGLPEAATFAFLPSATTTTATTTTTTTTTTHGPPDEVIAGYVTVRKSAGGWRMGPLAARDYAVANALFDAAVEHVTRQLAREPAESSDRESESDRSAPVSVFLDIPDDNADAVRMVNARGMRPAFDCIRMYTKGRPPLDSSRIFGITTFELG